MSPIIFANEIALLKVIVFIVAVTIYAINHLLGAMKKTAQQQRAARPPEAARPASPGRQDLEAELQEFLQRAADKRVEPAARPVAAGSDAPRRSKRKKSVAAAGPIIEAQAVDEPLRKRRIMPRVETSAFEQRAEQMTQVGRDDEIQSRVHQVFDHQVGQLATGSATAQAAQPDASAETPQPDATTAQELMVWLARTQSLRGAVVLNEILARPEHRW
jgi:hypothetical protein